MPGADDDADGQSPVGDDEQLLRRFSRAHPDHTTDEGTGARRLSSAALRFDQDGCSCHRQSVLETHGLDRSDVRHPDYPDLAVFVVGEVRAVSIDVEGAPVTPFDAAPDPWPRGRAGSPVSDVAHALITQVPLPSRAQKRALRALARHAVLK